MNISSDTISIVALILSIISLLTSLYQGAIDRKLAWEQLRGEIRARLTLHGIEILIMVDKLQLLPEPEWVGVVKNLRRILEALIAMRETLKGLNLPPLFPTGIFLMKLTSIKSDLDDADPVFERLQSSINDLDISEATRTSNGLIERLYGSKGQNSQVENASSHKANSV